MLRGRRRNDGTVGKDVMLPNGVEVIDPRFIENDLSILDSQAAQPDKICAVFGMSKSLLGIEDIDKYATFQGRRDVYLTNTLLPMLHGIESTLDAYLRRYMTSGWQAFVRFDIAKLEAYAEQLKAKFEMANAAHAAGLPWAVCNERFQLGLPIEDVPGADDVLVPMGSVPLTKLIEEWEADPGDPAPPPDGSAPPPDEPDPVPPAGSDDGAAAPARKGLTQQLVNKRASDPRATLQRQIRITRAEKAMRDDWRKVVGAASKQAQRAVADATNADRVNAAISGATLGLGDKLVAVAEKYHQRAASEGSRSIIELTTGKMSEVSMSTPPPPKTPRRRRAFTPEFKAEAVRLATQHGRPRGPRHHRQAAGGRRASAGAARRACRARAMAAPSRTRSRRPHRACSRAPRGSGRGTSSIRRCSPASHGRARSRSMARAWSPR